ncbi:MAG: hypothetical protein RBR07_06485 [Arcobacteraceae bacterium]|nr:hypothetical protein [Arcobacteraceae bacterium]
MKNEILAQLEQGLLSQEKICDRIIKLMMEEQDFLLDSTGINITDLEDIRRKINLLIEKLVSNLNNELNINILKYEINFEKHSFQISIQNEENILDINIIVEIDGFLMEINE